MKYWEQDWEQAIYRSIESLGREACLPEIYEKVSDFVDLTDSHLRTTKWGGRPAYHHIVRSYITNMCQLGLLRRVSRGCYRIIEYKIRENHE